MTNGDQSNDYVVCFLADWFLRCISLMWAASCSRVGRKKTYCYDFIGPVSVAFSIARSRLGKILSSVLHCFKFKGMPRIVAVWFKNRRISKTTSPSLLHKETMTFPDKENYFK